MTSELMYGIYPGSGVGIDPGSGLILGQPDDPRQINTYLDLLQPDDRPFLVRGYMHYTGGDSPANLTPQDMRQYVRKQRKLDLVLCYRSESGDLEDWVRFVRAILGEYAPFLAKLQLTEEPNNPDTASGGDGIFPNVVGAIIAGVVAAKAEIQRLGYPIQAGFNATPSFDPQNVFWKDIARQPDHAEFSAALDYVGLDFFPDVFRPLPPGLGLADAVRAVLENYRRANLAAGNISPATPIHITEHGWPTGPNRTEEQQAAVLNEVLGVIDGLKAELNITHYEFFDLRDAYHAPQELGFGLLRDDYSPKPAFSVFQKWVKGPS